MKDVKRIDYFSYEELTILGGSKLPLVNFELFDPSNFEEAKAALIEKELVTENDKLTDAGFKVATLVREYISADEYILLSRFKNNGFQIRIISKDIAWWSIVQSYPLLMRQEKSNDWDFKQIDKETLENLNNESIDTIGRVLEIEIYNHQGDPQQSLYNIYEQNDLLLIRYPLKDKVLNVHIGVINTFIRELFGFNTDENHINKAEE
ncbi:TPA: DUF5081 family protein [Staphylococcus aureus]|nr:DUF5081 family protein [Staphylococcus aureus]HDP4216776.1 DUF5081 family protein [Staphylococcus aureus]HDP4220271.1 DUF5081 family protein [Staphylococcus aureus]HDR2083677.1 DUF5081 family protein [Staphylococcus aureus]